MDKTIKIMYDYFTDFWKLIKKYAALPQTDQEWENLIAESGDLYEKHNSEDDSPESILFKKIVVDWLEYINAKEHIRINTLN